MRTARKQARHLRANLPLTVLLAVGSLVVLFPLYMAVVIALKTPEQMGEHLLRFPLNPQWRNFAQAVEVSNFFSAMRHSAILTVSSVVLMVLTNSMVGYAIARNLHRRYFRFLYFYFVSAMFIPFPIIMLPIVKQMTILGLDNLQGLIVLYMVYGMAINVFLYVGYVKSVPKELEEAAMIDGAGTWYSFWKIIFPIISPINATVAILNSLWVWNDFMLPLVILSGRQVLTLPLAQFAFQSQFSTDYNLGFASYLLALAPMVIIYLFLQRWIIGGITRGTIK